MKSYLAAILGLLAAGCVTTPDVADDKSAIVGVVMARAHSAVLAKRALDEQFIPAYDRVNLLADGLIDYDNLKEIYVGLVAPGRQSRKLLS